MRDLTLIERELPLVGKVALFQYGNGPMTEQRYASLRTKNSTKLAVLQQVLQQDKCFTDVAAAIKQAERVLQEEELQRRRYTLLNYAGLAKENDKLFRSWDRPMKMEMLEKTILELEVAVVSIALKLGVNIPPTLILKRVPLSLGNDLSATANAA